MKRTTISIFISLLVLVGLATVPILAQGGLPGGETIEIEGMVASIVENVWTITVDEEPVQVLSNDQTKLIDNPVVGNEVEVKAEVQADDSLLALEIKNETKLEKVEFKGVVESIVEAVWTISVDGESVTVVSNDQTKLIDNPVVGSEVEVKAEVQADDSLLALEIKNETKLEKVEFKGVVESIVETVWTISVDGESVEVLSNDQTKLIDNPVVGSEVEVKAEVQADGSLLALEIKNETKLEKVEFKGVVESIVETVWTISVDGESVQVQINTLTQIFGNPVVDDEVEVKAVEQADGTLLALVIKNETKPKPPKWIEIEGVVDTIGEEAWTILVDEEPVDVFVDELTQIRGQPEEGDTVEVKAVEQPDGSLLALRIKNESKPEPPKRVDFKGEVTAIDGNMWTILVNEDSVAVLTTDETEYIRNPGIGDEVKVKAVEQPNGTLLALEIKNEEKPEPPEMVELKGVVSDIVDDVWTIEVEGELVDILTNKRTKLVRESGIGDTVEVKAIEQADGTLLAIVIINEKPEPPKNPAGPPQMFEGIVQSIDGAVWTLLVDGEKISILTNDQTNLVRNPGEGDEVGVVARPAQDGEDLVAKLIIVLEDEEPLPPADPLQSYVVVLRDDVPNPDGVAGEIAERLEGKVGFVYTEIINGFSIWLPERAASALQRDPRIASVEPDIEIHIAAQDTPTGMQRIFAANNPYINFDGVDNRVDVDVAVIDTGIDLEHPDLNNHASIDCTYETYHRRWGASAYCAEGGDDDHYHGTHVAGAIGALDNDYGVVGVAPGARLWSVKVLRGDGSGSMSMLIAGIEYVTGNADQIEVANISLGGQGSDNSVDAAISESISKGVVYVVAAGNSAADASTFIPASHPDVVTVSALTDYDGAAGGVAAATSSCYSDVDDTLANFSNWGYAIDIAAPGVCIRSTMPVEYGSYGVASGTSMASPHVAGAAALLASGPNAPQNKIEVDALIAKLKNSGNTNWVDDSGDGIQEPLLDVSDKLVFAPVMVGDASTGGDTNDAPVAAFSFSAEALTVAFSDDSSDADGDVLAWQWDFGDGNTSTAQNPTHTYAAAGTYEVVLTVADDDGATDSLSHSVTVVASSTSSITLNAVGYKVRGRHTVDLTWSGATTSKVDIYRDGQILTSTANDGFHTDKMKQVGSGTYTYQLCEQDSNVCSQPVLVDIS